MQLIHVIKEKMKNNRVILNIYLSVRAKFRWLYQPFGYAKLVYNKNLTQQKVLYPVNDGLKVFLPEMVRQKKFDSLLPCINNGMRILDIAAGNGELGYYLINIHHKKIEYVGLDYDPSRVLDAENNNIDVRLLDVSNLNALSKFIKDNGPYDVIVCMYALYFFPEPEKFLELIKGKSKLIFLGVFNGGHIQYRIRLLFGRSATPGFHYYPVAERQTNYAEMTRFWTLADYKFVLDELGYKNTKLISVKNEGTSIHHTPRWYLFPSAFSMAFILKSDCK